MKHRVLLLSSLLLLLTGCARSVPKDYTPTPVVIDTAADAAIRAEDGYTPLDSYFENLLGCQMLIPQSLGWYKTDDGVYRFSDRSGTNLMTFETRIGDNYERCYTSYLHDIGCRLPANRIQTYDPQTIGTAQYNARRIDAREQENDQPERLISYWFIARPRSEGRREACYIVTIETVPENLDAMMNCISSFATSEDFAYDRKENAE